ncbi:MAG TPA: zf-HC2 domain-containing protein [Gemmataceae bacterium]|nr:zf-HC2 domain-containing protein [Gemmataceae bacterium]
MITCRELMDLLGDLVDGDLPAAQRAHVEQHLQTCPPCHAYCQSYRLTVRLCRKLPCPPPPPEVMRRLRAAVCAHLQMPPPEPGAPGSRPAAP